MATLDDFFTGITEVHLVDSVDFIPDSLDRSTVDPNVSYVPRIQEDPATGTAVAAPVSPAAPPSAPAPAPVTFSPSGTVAAAAPATTTTATVPVAGPGSAAAPAGAPVPAEWMPLDHFQVVLYRKENALWIYVSSTWKRDEPTEYTVQALYMYNSATSLIQKLDISTKTIPSALVNGIRASKKGVESERIFQLQKELQ